jgi:hypothetical protein
MDPKMALLKAREDNAPIAPVINEKETDTSNMYPKYKMIEAL